LVFGTVNRPCCVDADVKLVALRGFTDTAGEPDGEGDVATNWVRAAAAALTGGVLDVPEDECPEVLGVNEAEFPLPTEALELAV
jgi:hypothetical protein